MPKVKLYNMDAEVVGDLSLSDNVFAADYNESLIHEVVVAQNANSRQGTKSTLTRAEVRGHAKKPWKQKHTGRARHGSSKSPQWRGGGVAFAPKPRDFSKKVNKQAKKSALVSALSAKLAQEELTVINEIKLSEVKTKNVKKILDNFKFNKSVMIVTNKKDDQVLRASSNIPNVSVTNTDLINAYDVVANKNVIFTEAAIKSLEEALA